MDEDSKKGPHRFRPFHVKAGEEKSCRHSQGRKLVRRKKETEEVRLSLFSAARSYFIKPLGHGEAVKDNHQYLGHGDKLHVGKAFFPKEHVGAEARQGAYISQHHGNHVASLVQGVGETVLLESVEKENRDKADRQDGNGKPQKLPRHVHSPEGNQ